MSLYLPDPKTLYPARLADGWWVMDRFGPLSGPYATARDAQVTIGFARDDYEAIPGRHSSYKDA